MSRSRKKSKIHGITTAESEKQDKQEANRRLRRVVKQKVNQGETELPELREISNIWGFAKDGKIYHPETPKKLMRK